MIAKLLFCKFDVNRTDIIWMIDNSRTDTSMTNSLNAIISFGRKIEFVCVKRRERENAREG